MRVVITVNFDQEYTARKAYIEECIAGYLPKEEGFAAALAQAMNYSMLAGGKRLRPMLLWESYRLFGGEGRVCEPFMAAIEMIHTHSLIHDDLPAIDNDELRRGRKTTHVVYGEALGVLSGDALLNYAYETAFSAFSLTGDAALVGKALRILAEKTGIHGMLGGQSVDVMNDGKPLTRELLDYIYENKTARLLEAPLMIGALLAGAPQEKVRRMEEIGTLVGVSFQIQDDILDVTGSTEELGKQIRSDEKNHKVTYVTLRGLDGAAGDVRELSQKALLLLDGLEEKNAFLKELIRQLVTRRR